MRPLPAFAFRLYAVPLAAVAAAAACSAAPRPAADLIVTHARIWTGDPRNPEAAALAVIGERIVDIGSAAHIDAWRGGDTQVVDAESRRVVPGFNDSHVHIVNGGVALEQVDLRDASDGDEIARRIGQRARSSPGEWITGGFWNARFSPSDLPARAAVDDVTNGTPVFVVDAGRRRALVNAAAFGRAGITEQTVDPPDGRIVRDGRGLPTGLIEGAALDLVERAVPRPAHADRVRAIKRALERAATLGVTSLQDVGASGDDIAAFADLAGRGELTARIYAVPNEAGWYDQAKLGIRRGFGSPWLRLGAIAGTAAAGTDARATDLLRTRLMAADHAALQVCLIAAGAEAAADALDRLDDIVRADGERDRRFRIEHAEHGAAHAARFASEQAVASLQPGDSAGGAFAAFSRAHVRVALGSGWPSSPLDPIGVLRAAAAQATVAEAISAYTRGSAFAEFQDGEKGTLARGRLADLVVLSGDPFAVSAAGLAGISVLTTIAGGKVVHQRRP